MPILHIAIGKGAMLLDSIKTSADVKKLNIEQLKALAEEIRQKIIDTAMLSGGHLSANLGIVETTLALHYVFDLPTDKLVFDVGHQCYTHKLLSGRGEAFEFLRKENGVSGFQDREESEFDPLSTGHAGTSISAGLGLCKARDVLGDSYKVINVVGDGALTNGLNLEAIFSDVVKPKNYLVILNDNGMSISKNSNGLYRSLSKSSIKGKYIRRKRRIKRVFKNSFITKFLKKSREFIKRVFNKNNYLEMFGLKYVGTVNGNDIEEMIDVLTAVKNSSEQKAVLLHVITTKGKGLAQAEEHSDAYHGVDKDLTHKESKFSNALGKKLCELIEKDKSIVAVTAAMKDGTGLKAVEEAFPNNFIDVGIAEEYAVTLASGMAVGGLKPVVAIYSTFLQRGYDQIVHDVCLQNLPVVFCIDRAGVVGADGKTHQGVFDINYLSHLPNMRVFAPADLAEFNKMLEYAISLNCPVAIRYPAMCTVNELDTPLENVFEWPVITDGNDVTILAVGPRMVELAKRVSQRSDVSVKVINARSVKPLDGKVLSSLTGVVISLEESSVIGGFGANVSKYLHVNDISVKFYPLGIKDKFIKHGTVSGQLAENGLSVEEVNKVIDKVIGNN